GDRVNYFSSFDIQHSVNFKSHIHNVCRGISGSDYLWNICRDWLFIFKDARIEMIYNKSVI
ncbi:hypothetical protein P9029_15175, partial [Bacillus thuringiensis]